MNLLPETQERLSFLVRVISKEIKHLDYADSQAFGASLTLDKVENLEQDPALALKLEAFVSRFCRLQDTLGDKLLPALLNTLGESANALLFNLNKAEKYGWLESTEEWTSLRQLRNKMIHEYIEEAEILHSSLMTAHQNIEVLKAFAENLTRQVKQLQE